MGDHANELQANDPVSGRTVWRVEWPTANYTPVMATAGDLVFQGGSDQGCSAPSTPVPVTSSGRSGPGPLSRARPYRTWDPTAGST